MTYWLAHETVAIVRHANQYVIGDGYSDRQGMTEILGLRGAISHPAGFMRAVRELQQTSIAVSAPLDHRNGVWLRERIGCPCLHRRCEPLRDTDLLRRWSRPGNFPSHQRHLS